MSEFHNDVCGALSVLQLHISPWFKPSVHVFVLGGSHRASRAGINQQLLIILPKYLSNIKPKGGPTSHPGFTHAIFVAGHEAW